MATAQYLVRSPKSVVRSSRLPTTVYRLRTAQALLELAVFGSLIILVLGAVINYGLNADANQRVMMSSFRQALSSAAKAQDPNTPIVATHIVNHDQYLPDPASPFAVGSMIPISASAGGITRSSKIGRMFPENAGEVSRTYITVSGLQGKSQQVNCASGQDGCRGSGFRTETIPDTFLERYKEVYGAGSVCTESWCGGGQAGCVTQSSPGVCAQSGTQVLVVDVCDSQLPDRSGCLRQARLMHDSAYCTRECERGGAEGCATTCQGALPASMLPWYAKGCAAGVDGWTCPELDKLFEGIMSLGLQPGGVKDVEMDNTFARVEIGEDEDPQQQPNAPPPPHPVVNTKVSTNWVETSTRKMIYRTIGSERATIPLTSSINRQKVTTWETEWPK